MPRKSIKMEKNGKKFKSEETINDVEIFEVEAILDKRIIAGKVSEQKKMCALPAAVSRVPIECNLK